MGFKMEPSHMVICVLVAQSVLVISTDLSLKKTYRLPNFYFALNYSVVLDLSRELFTREGKYFNGEVKVHMQFNNQTDYIELHCDSSMIELESITFENSFRLSNGSYTVNDETDILTIYIGDQVNKIDLNKWYVLHINFKGTVSTTEIIGLYKDKYINSNGIVKYLLTTQLESTFARRIFPCFDEPGFKAYFDFTVSFPTGLNIFFNTPEISRSKIPQNRKTLVQFGRTPRMSTYTLALVISDFTCSERKINGTIPLRVCTRDDYSRYRHLALFVTPKLLLELNHYTKIKYDTAVEKLDIVAIPNLRAGAMENWGLVIFRESTLTFDYYKPKPDLEQEIICMITHELAHQWFGNLVTIFWWSDIVIQEGISSYMQYYITNEVFPEYQLEKRHIVDHIHNALEEDSKYDTVPIYRSQLDTMMAIDKTFTPIVYHKGGAIFRMIEHFMTEPRFRQGLQNYLLSHKYWNADCEVLWAELNKTISDSISKMPANLTTVMEKWIKDTGYPIVKISKNGAQFTISQAQFALEGIANENTWYIPISFTTSNQSNKFQSTTPDFWLTPNSTIELDFTPGNKWIILNNQQTGFYRVCYDDNIWDGISAALQKEDFDGIIDINRAQLIDDVFSLAEANARNFSFALGKLHFLKHDTSYYPWYAALKRYNWILTKIGYNSVLGEAIMKEILVLIEQFYNSVRLSQLREHDNFYTLKQTLAAEWACHVGLQSCLDEVADMFASYKLSTSSFRPKTLSLKKIVFCVAMAQSQDPNDWTFILELYLKLQSNDGQKEVFRKALACTKNKELLERYLDMAIKNPLIDSEEIKYIFWAVADNTVGVDVAFDFLIANQNYIIKHFHHYNILASIWSGVVHKFTSKIQFEKLEDIVSSGNLQGEFQLYGNLATFITKMREDWIDHYSEDLITHYSVKKHYFGVAIGFSVVLMLLILILIYLFTGRRLLAIISLFRRSRDPVPQPEENIPMQVLE